MISLAFMFLLAASLKPGGVPARPGQASPDPAVCAIPAFFPSNPATSPVGYPVVADFNLDGNADLVAMDHSAQVATMWLGDGHGGIASAGPPVSIGGFVDYGLGTYVVEDFNSDGKPDVAVLTKEKGAELRHLVLLLGDGAGGLTPGPLLSFPPVNTSWMPVASSGDFNLDGKVDIAAAVFTSQTSGGIAILLGDGAGGLTVTGPSLPAAEVAVTVVADFNQDGKPDIVSNAGYTTNVITTYLGDGSGGFTKGPESWGAAQSFPHLSMGDFNGDGKLDLAGLSYIHSKIPILVGDGAGGFTTASVISVPYPTAGVGGPVVGDFNADGKPDLVVGTGGVGYGLTVLLGDGASGFSPIFHDKASSISPSATADFNRDGYPDLVASGPSGSVSILLNNCGAAPSTTSVVSSPNPAPFSQPATFTATVSPAAGPGTPTGRVQFKDGTADLGSAVSLSGGVATLAVSTLTEGAHEIRAVYLGDAGFQGSTSAPWSHAVSYRPASLTVITSSPNPSTDTQPVTLTATVSPLSGPGTPTGSVVFKRGTGELRAVTLNGGVAVLNAGSWSDGVHSFTASYSGDASFAPSVSAPVIQLVPGRLNINDFTVNAALGSATVSVAVRLTSASASTVEVDYATVDHTARDGVDYTASSGHLTFNPGETSKTIPVPIIGQNVPGPSKDFFVALTNPSGAAVKTGTATGLIYYEAPGSPSIYIDDPVVLEGRSGVTLIGFTVTLSSGSLSTVTVDYSTANLTATAGQDYTATSGTLKFAITQKRRFIVVPIAGDAIAGSNRTFVVNLSNPVAASIGKAQGTATIVDDDPGSAAVTVGQYRLYSAVTKEHLYTTDSNEYAVLPGRGWTQEGSAYTMFKDTGFFGARFAVPLYRLYHDGSKQHHWTTDTNEVTVLVSTGVWDYEGIAGYLLPETETGTTPLYRLMLKNPPLHLWTTDLNEKTVLSTQRGWVYEGIVGYVIP